jgi:glucose-fructose oxidoreductase
MTAYRLHFDRINLEAVQLVRDGAIGEPKFFTSAFGLTVKPGNIRTERELGGGTLYDLGVYCINAARYLFAAEPKEVFASAVNTVPDRLPEIDESTSAILRFDGERLATFTTSFNSADASWYRITGDRGDLLVEPAYEYAEGLGYTLRVEGKTTRKKATKKDQFAAELLYFSDCVLDDRDPEPSGEEGLQDVRIVRALYESADAGKPIPVPPYEPKARPGPEQAISRPPAKKPVLVNAESASE